MFLSPRMLSMRRSAFSFGSVIGTLELDMRVWPAAESLKPLPVIDLVKDQSSFCPFFGLRLVINFSQADFLALMITLLFVASFFRQFSIFSLEKGEDLHSARALRVSLTCVWHSSDHHGLSFSGVIRWVGLVILKKLWLVSIREL